MSKKLDTSEKILQASMSLFSQKGYNAVTTKEIAQEAGVSEMTLFRHFESKRNLFEKAIFNYVFYPKIKSVFDNHLEWNLETDLLKITNIYQEILAKNKKVILTVLKDSDISSNKVPIMKFPIEFKKLLVNYFSEMRAKGIIKDNPELLAISFLATNFGMFVAKNLFCELTSDIDIDSCIETHIKIFTKGITS